MITKNEIFLFIDIHGASNHHGFAIELGTNYGKNVNDQMDIVNILLNSLSMVGHVSIDTTFPANWGVTVSKYIHDLTNIPCIQIEISNSIRMDPQKLERFVHQFHLVMLQIVKWNESKGEGKWKKQKCILPKQLPQRK